MEGIVEAVNEGDEGKVKESLKAFCEKVWFRYPLLGLKGFQTGVASKSAVCHSSLLLVIPLSNRPFS